MSEAGSFICSKHRSRYRTTLSAVYDIVPALSVMGRRTEPSTSTLTTALSSQHGPVCRIQDGNLQNKLNN
jgi:hypothetical protein